MWCPSDGELPPSSAPEPPDLAAFVASLSSAWRAGEVRSTLSVAAKPRYLRSLQRVFRADATPARTPGRGVHRARHGARPGLRRQGIASAVSLSALHERGRLSPG